MKKYLSDFFVGLVVGIVLFFVSSYLGFSVLTWSDSILHLVVFIILFSIYFFYFRRSKSVKVAISMLIFFIAFALPTIIWSVIVFGAIYNFAH